ncbi:MAG: GAF and ANTAR domain-containing protein [Acidimicrobiales bacterium]
MLLDALDRDMLIVPSRRRFCRTSSEILGVTGVGVTLLDGARLFGQIGASDDIAVGLEWAEFALGEGPRALAAASGRPVLDPDMVEAECRYPLFAPAARALGANAIFTFPICSASSVIGTLSFYNDASGDLSGDQLVRASLLAKTALALIRAAMSSCSDGEVPDELAHVGKDRNSVHQATGMISAQLHLSMADALGALRAHAWATNEPLAEVSAAVIERRLRLD